MAEKTSYLTADNSATKARVWLSSLGDARRKRWRTFAWGHAALIILDMQQYFLGPESTAYLPTAPIILPTVMEVADRCAQHERPTVLTYVGSHDGENDPLGRFWGRTIRDGSAACQIAPELLRTKNHFIMRKTGYSAFSGTPLERNLREWNTKSILLAGVATNLCCQATAWDGFDRGFDVFVLADAMAAANEEIHLTSLQILATGCATPLLSCDV